MILALAQVVLQGGVIGPLGSGTEPFPLRATYGQLVGEPDAVDLHFGTDVLVRTGLAEGDSVRALEEGVVVQIDTSTDYRSGLVIQSSSGRLLLYLHLDRKTIPYVLNDHVGVGKYLGSVTWTDPEVLGRHVHVSELGSLSAVWTGIDKKSIKNPLLPLKQEDLLRPRSRLFPTGRRLAVRSNEAAGVPPTYHGLDRVPGGKPVDVLANLYDWDDSQTDRPLAPARIELTVSSEGRVLQTFGFDFDRSLEAYHNFEDVIYNRDSVYRSIPVTDFKLCSNYFVLTNGGPDSYSKANHWLTAPGRYVLSVRAWDAANNTLEFQENLVVVP